MKNFGKNSRGRSQGVPKFFSAPIYGAHCAGISDVSECACAGNPLSDGPPDVPLAYDVGGRNNTVVGLCCSSSVRGLSSRSASAGITANSHIYSVVMSAEEV